MLQYVRQHMDHIQLVVFENTVHMGHLWATYWLPIWAAYGPHMDCPYLPHMWPICFGRSGVTNYDSHQSQVPNFFDERSCVKQLLRSSKYSTTVCLELRALCGNNYDQGVTHNARIFWI